ncbi:MAG: YfcE family phosphodiesterase [Oscillospiraceae bacterium]|nr:YfcE family phosphodiesterase [Oscillospiraceae bacterium]
MQLLVISDTHGHYSILRDTILSHPDSEQVIFLGDGEEEYERFCREYPVESRRVYAVRGNCDHSLTTPLRIVHALPYGHKLVAVHGHYHMAGDYHYKLVELAREEKADIVLFGHLHMRIDQTLRGVRLFNPGSAAVPRDGLPPSFGLVDIMDSGVLTSHGDLPPSPYDMVD